MAGADTASSGCPEQYSVPKEDGQALLARFKKVVAVSKITTISEGPPNATAFIAAIDARYAAAETQPHK